MSKTVVRYPEDLLALKQAEYRELADTLIDRRSHETKLNLFHKDFNPPEKVAMVNGTLLRLMEEIRFLSARPDCHIDQLMFLFTTEQIANMEIVSR